MCTSSSRWLQDKYGPTVQLERTDTDGARLCRFAATWTGLRALHSPVDPSHPFVVPAYRPRAAKRTPPCPHQAAPAQRVRVMKARTSMPHARHAKERTLAHECKYSHARMHVCTLKHAGNAHTEQSVRASKASGAMPKHHPRHQPINAKCPGRTHSRCVERRGRSTHVAV